MKKKEKRGTWKLHAVLLTIFRKLILTLNCYSVMVSSWRHLTVIVPTWKYTLTLWWPSTSKTVPGNPPQVRDGVVTLASPSLMLKHRTVVYFPVPCKWNIIVFRKPRRTGTSPLICFTNQFTDFYITQISTVSHLQTCSSMKIIKAPQRESNIRNTPGILTTLKTKLNLAFNIIRTPKSYHKLRHYGPFENSLHRKKPHHV